MIIFPQTCSQDFLGGVEPNEEYFWIQPLTPPPKKKTPKQKNKNKNKTKQNKQNIFNLLCGKK